MLISYNWLSEFIDIKGIDPKKIADSLTSIGLETAIVEDRRDWYNNMFVAKVHSRSELPNYEKLLLLEVELANLQRKKIVAGDKSLAVGELIPVALQGALTPDKLQIENRKFGEILSEGMALSESELKISTDNTRVARLDSSLEVGDSLANQLGIDDLILDVELTPNRGDAASIVGIAREIAATLDLQIKMPQIEFQESKISNQIKVVSHDLPSLLRYSARSISNIKVKEGPLFIRSRLYTLGFRPINNVVDITNYILLESGHPLHAFDRSLLEEDRIVIRNALEGEELTALNGSKLKLSSNDLIIADGKRPVALAGVIGGANSEVSDATTSIILEAAIFDPVTVRRSSKSHQISTESSYRFERGVDIDSILVAQARALTLLAKYADGVVSPDGVDIYPDKKKGLQVPIRFKKVRDIYLDSIDNKTIVDILTRLGLLLVEQDEVAAKFEIPSFRHDLEREIDLVEEVARINGYDKVIATTPLTPPDTTGKSSLHKLSNKARAHLRSRGMLEGLGLSFMNEEDFRALCYSDSEIKSALKIDNPMNSEWTFLRTTLMKSLLNSASRLGSESIFEIGVVFSNDPSDLDAKPTERLFLSGIFSSKQPLNLWNKKLGDRDFYDLSGVVEDLLSAIEFHNCYQLVATGRSFFYPNRQSEIIIDSNLVGCFGQIHPSSQENFDLADPHFIFELDLTKIATIKKNPIVYKKIVKFPIVKRDLAILVDHNLEIGKIKEAIYEFGGPKLITATLFDIFRSEKIGNDKKSVAFGLEFQDSNSTLRDDDVDQIFDKIVRKLDEKFQASLR